MPVFFNLFVAAEPLQAVKSVAEPRVKSVRLCKLNVIINSIVAYTVCWYCLLYTSDAADE